MMRYAKASFPPSENVAGSNDRQSFVWENVEYIFENEQFASEATGVLHLVHGWPDQGRDAKKVDCSNLRCTLMIFIAIARDSSVKRYDIRTSWSASRSGLLSSHRDFSVALGRNVSQVLSGIL